MKSVSKTPPKRRYKKEIVFGFFEVWRPRCSHGGPKGSPRVKSTRKSYQNGGQMVARIVWTGPGKWNFVGFGFRIRVLASEYGDLHENWLRVHLDIFRMPPRCFPDASQMPPKCSPCPCPMLFHKKCCLGSHAGVITFDCASFCLEFKRASLQAISGQHGTF